VLSLPVMPFKLTVFRYDCIIGNFAEDLNQQDRQLALSQLLRSESCIHIYRSFLQLWFTRKFLPDITTLTSVTDSLENIVSWDEIIFCQCCVLT